MPTPALDQIKQLYFNATRTTIRRDVDRAIDLLKTMKTDDERMQAAVYMDGLSQMRSEWAAAGRHPDKGTGQRAKGRNKD